MHEKRTSATHVVCVTLIKAIRHHLFYYDLHYAHKETNVLRYSILTFLDTINEIEDKLKTPSKSVNITYWQQQYEALCRALENFVIELKHSEQHFYRYFSKLLINYHIELPDIIFLEPLSLTPEELNMLQKIETKNYYEAMYTLQAQLDALPHTMIEIKQSGHELIKHIRDSRKYCEKTACCFLRKPFDYKRQTINLIQTSELLANPQDITTQNNYTLLIHINKKSAGSCIHQAMTTFCKFIVNAFMMLTSIIPSCCLSNIARSAHTSTTSTYLDYRYHPEKQMTVVRDHILTKK